MKTYCQIGRTVEKKSKISKLKQKQAQDEQKYGAGMLYLKCKTSSSPHFLFALLTRRNFARV